MYVCVCVVCMNVCVFLILFLFLPSSHPSFILLSLLFQANKHTIKIHKKTAYIIDTHKHTCNTHYTTYFR